MAKESVAKDTGMMGQWREMKARHPNAILLYRVGDFYETFFEDAEVASRALGLTLTSRNNGGAAEVPLAGVPARAVGEYVRRLVQQGYRVAICEQVEDPKLAKGIVRREVIETVTPGAVFADELLDGSRNNFVAAVAPVAGVGMGGEIGLAVADISTGDFRLAITAEVELEAALARYQPREVLVPTPHAQRPTPRLPDDVLVTERDAWEFDVAMAADDLARQFRVHSLEGLGLGEADAPALAAAGALLRYLRELQPSGLPHLGRPI
ncbi:MAG TPA: hypothetical protein VEA99_16775, partial [Gemmatimonadaceae bacterium]|nr:hypothetical protein [Gemmatimonadaceae bacterium]